jgi:hypothetical protein
MAEDYALINSENVVVNMVLWDGVTPWTPPDGCTPIKINSQPCDIGWIYDPQTGTFSPPPAP